MIWNAILAGFKDSGMDPRGGKRGRCSRGFPVQRCWMEGSWWTMEVQHFMLKDYSPENVAFDF